MKWMRAPVLLLIYIALASSAVLPEHQCHEECGKYDIYNSPHEKTSVPFGCKDGEVINKTLIEHRALSVNKLRIRTAFTAPQSADKNLNELIFASARLMYPYATFPSPVPIYKLHCLYRL